MKEPLRKMLTAHLKDINEAISLATAVNDLSALIALLDLRFRMTSFDWSKRLDTEETL